MGVDVSVGGLVLYRGRGGEPLLLLLRNAGGKAGAAAGMCVFTFSRCCV